MTATVEQIKTELADCEAAARREGWEGAWEPTAADLESVCAALGHKPSREEWQSAGLGWVGDAHVGEGH